MTPEGSRMVAGASRPARPPDPRPLIHSTPEGSRKGFAQTCGFAMRTRPLPGWDIGHPLTGGSELTLATTGYRARPETSPGCSLSPSQTGRPEPGLAHPQRAAAFDIAACSFNDLDRPPALLAGWHPARVRPDPS